MLADLRESWAGAKRAARLTHLVLRALLHMAMQRKPNGASVARAVRAAGSQSDREQ